MKRNFEMVLALVLTFEGGTADDPRDPGGLTRCGITQATLSRWLKRPATREEVLALDRATISAIYRAFYWDAVRGDDLPSGIDGAVFDFAINSGPATAIKALQRIVGVVPDGIIGLKTLAALSRIPPRDLVTQLCDARLGFMQRLTIWRIFGRGWTRRVETLRIACLAQCGTGRRRPVRSTVPLPQKDSAVKQVKPFLLSRTVWTNFIGLLALVLPILGFKTSDVDANQITDAVFQIIAGGSFVASTIFRVKATKALQA